MHYTIVKINDEYSIALEQPSSRVIPEKGNHPSSTVLIPAPSVLGAARVITSDSVPTQEQMIAAFGDDALSKSKKAKDEAIFKAAYAALTAIFASLPAGPQAQFRPVEDAIVAAAKEKNWTLAAEILSTAVVPEALTSAQAAMVTALTPYLSLATSLAAATTIDEVNAISVP